MKRVLFSALACMVSTAALGQEWRQAFDQKYLGSSGLAFAQVDGKTYAFGFVSRYAARDVGLYGFANCSYAAGSVLNPLQPDDAKQMQRMTLVTKGDAKYDSVYTSYKTRCWSPESWAQWAGDIADKGKKAAEEAKGVFK